MSGFLLQDVTKRFGEREVLHEFSLEVSPGEIIGLSGPSGSGKTTVLNILATLEGLDGGEFRVGGESAPKPRTPQSTRFLRWNVGYLFQNFALVDSMSVSDNMNIATRYGSGMYTKSEVPKALEAVGLHGYERKRIHSLSGGEQLRVALARLMCKPCDIILADEPTASLDGENRRIAEVILTQFAESGRAVVIATHDEALLQRCEKVFTTGG